MAPDDRWLAAVWPFVSGQLPPTPATVLEVGCGTLGGFVRVDSEPGRTTFTVTLPRFTAGPQERHTVGIGGSNNVEA